MRHMTLGAVLRGSAPARLLVHSLHVALIISAADTQAQGR